MLTADTTTITDANGVPTDPNAFTYQWVREDSGTDADITGATAPYYYPTADDVGKTLKVKVSFTDDASYSEGPLTSAASAAVAANDNVKVIWTSTLIAVVASTGLTGYNSSATSELNAGSLSDPDFDFDSTTYTVEQISTVASGGDYNTLFAISPAMTAIELETLDRWTLYVNDESRFISDGQSTSTSDKSNVTWVVGSTDSPGVMTWAEGQHVALALMAVNSPATGAPAITGAAQVDEVLQVDTSGIADDNGKPAKPGGFKYRWLRVEGGVETEITGETSWAYTVTADDVGKTLKVEVSYTDGDGFEEDPLTSDASDVIEAVDLSAIDFTHYEGFSLHADNGSPWSIWSDGTTLWVGDDDDSYFYAYHLVDDPMTTDNEYGTRDSAKDINGVTSETYIIAGDDNYIWTADYTLGMGVSDASVYAYNRSGRTRDSSKDFAYRDTAATYGHTLAFFIESDGEYVWIAPSASTAHAWHITDDPNTDGRRIRDPGQQPQHRLLVRALWTPYRGQYHLGYPENRGRGDD